MIIPKMNVPQKLDAQAIGAEGDMRERSRSKRCARIKDLGFTSSRHIKMYGESFELVSDPFSDGDGVAVRAISGKDPEIRTLRLPTTILVGSGDRFLTKPDITGQSTL
ncbi:MAG: hypothetical protein WBX02_18875 [Terriglobales bacterium]